MPQPTRPQWQKSVLQTVAHAERVLRGKTSLISADPSNLRQIRNFLVLQFESPLGSVVHATPLFEALKRAMPNAHITVAASSMAASVLSHSPYIDRCVTTPNPFVSFSKAFAAVRELVRTMPPGPHCIVTTIGNQRTRLAMLSLLVDDAIRVGYTLAPEIYDCPLNFLPERGQIQGNLDIVRSIGHDVAFFEPHIFFTQHDVEHANQLLGSLSESPGTPRVAYVTQNSGGQRNQWSANRFLQVIGLLEKTCGAVPVFVGTHQDVESIESLRHQLANPGITLAGKTTIPQLAAVLAQCDLLVSLDTGTFHVARAVGLPGVVIAPAWQSPLEWLPVDHSHYRVLRGPSIATAPADYCMQEVSVEQVVNASVDLLASFPATSAERALRVQRSLCRTL